MKYRERAREAQCADVREGIALAVFEHRQGKNTLDSTNVSAGL
jgi:hypothetical protein